MITCTITPPPDCLARLAACPALPRGERLEWASSRAPYPKEFWLHRATDREGDRTLDSLLWAEVVETISWRDRAPGLMWWRSMARPLRVARERLRAARNARACPWCGYGTAMEWAP